MTKLSKSSMMEKIASLSKKAIEVPEGSDLVVDPKKSESRILKPFKPKKKGRGGMPGSVWFYEEDREKIDSIDLFCRENKLKADVSKIVRAGLSFLGKNKETLDAVRATFDQDRREKID